MKGFKKWLGAAAVAAAGLTALPAAAELQFGRMDTGLYLGASVGSGHYRHICNGTPAGASCDNDDVAGRAFVGWQFNQYFGLELGAAYLGKTQFEVAGVDVASVRNRNVDLVGVFSYPIHSMFSVYGKAGIARNRTTASTALIPGVLTSVSASDTSTNLTYGAGVRYNFTRNWAARAEWQRYHFGDDSFVPSDKIDYFSLGLLYGWY